MTAALERLELYYGDMDAHAQAFRAALSLEEAEAATHHRSALQALEKRIAASGDGTPEAPYAVLGPGRLRLGTPKEDRHRRCALPGGR